MTHKSSTRSPKTPLRFLVTAFSLFLLLPRAQGFAAPSSQFRQSLPGYKYQFPRDHASHPQFSTEWWYYTGHLQTADGRRFGYQLTFFRTALMPKLKGRTSKWAMRDIIFGHFAVTDLKTGRFLFCDRVERQALGLAKADEKEPRIWMGDWKLRFLGARGDQQTMQASGESQDGTSYGLQLTQNAAKPPVIHGERGVSQKSSGVGRASHYYSFPRLNTKGTLRIGNERFAVTGQSWFDHEFGSNQLGKDQIGWDWFSLQLSDGRELMLYQLRLKNGSTDPYSSGTLIERNGTTRHLKRADFKLTGTTQWKSRASGATYPAEWTVELPREKLRLRVVPAQADQELRTRYPVPFTYWEGSVDVSGDGGITGQGYVELTGYRKGLEARF